MIFLEIQIVFKFVFSVEENGKKLKIEEDEFLDHILRYAKNFQQYRLNVKV